MDHRKWRAEREREIEGIEKRETSDFLFFLFVVLQAGFHDEGDYGDLLVF